jgi:serpin B
VVSPLSTQIITSLAHLGARHDTATEISRAIHMPNNKEVVRDVYNVSLPLLTELRNYTLHLANKIYVKDRLVVKSKYKKLASEVYNAEVENINFSERGAVETLNNWVKIQTRQDIKDVATSDDLNNETTAVLINAVYFKAKWAQPFVRSYATVGDAFDTSVGVTTI